VQIPDALRYVKFMAGSWMNNKITINSKAEEKRKLLSRTSFNRCRYFV